MSNSNTPDMWDSQNSGYNSQSSSQSDDWGDTSGSYIDNDSSDSWDTNNQWGSSSDDWELASDDAVSNQNGSDDWELPNQNNDSNTQQGRFIDNQNNDWTLDGVDNNSSYGQVLDEQTPKKPFSLGYKSVGFILAGIILVIFFILFFIDNIKIEKKPVPQQQPQQQVQTQQTAQTTPQVSQQSNNVVSGSVVLVEIPENTALNYSGDVYEASGTVASKLKYIQGNQVLYSITVRIAVGSSTEDLSYYCNYASYQAVGVGDLVRVKYQQVSDGYISINEIFK